jgi:hypothetical protein
MNALLELERGIAARDSRTSRDIITGEFMGCPIEIEVRQTMTDQTATITLTTVMPRMVFRPDGTVDVYAPPKL